MWTGWNEPKARSDAEALDRDHLSRGMLDHSRFVRRSRQAWLKGLPSYLSLELPKVMPTFIAIGGGKGGVGKSLLSANLAAKLGQSGFRVLLVDLDLGGANLHTYFGLGLPQRTLADFLIFGDHSFGEIVSRTPVEGVLLAAGGRDETWSDSSNFSTGAFVGLWDALVYSKQSLDVDFVVFDLGAGTHRHTIDFFTAAHLGIVVVLPEPTSIENAYSFLKASMWKLIENSGMHCHVPNQADAVKEYLFSPNSHSQGSYVGKLRELSTKYPELVGHIFDAFSGRTIGLVVNQIRTQRDIDIGHSMETICKKYFGFETCSLGYLNYDDAAWKALRNRRLLSLDFPHSMINKRVNEVTRKMLEKLGYQGGTPPCTKK